MESRVLFPRLYSTSTRGSGDHLGLGRKSESPPHTHTPVYIYIYHARPRRRSNDFVYSKTRFIPKEKKQKATIRFRLFLNNTYINGYQSAPSTNEVYIHNVIAK